MPRCQVHIDARELKIEKIKIRKRDAEDADETHVLRMCPTSHACDSIGFFTWTAV